jgi:transcriptional regulator GlxA family with amidase domain
MEEFTAEETFPMDENGNFTGAGQAAKKNPREDGKIEDCIAYMVEHINQPTQVATLAALANVSLSHFFALFKQRTGCAPMDYFTRLRMRHACRLLDTSSASVKEVAAALGYDDPFYFSRVFKSVNHVAPSKYRAARLDFANESGTGSGSESAALEQESTDAAASLSDL